MPPKARARRTKDEGSVSGLDDPLPKFSPNYSDSGFHMLRMIYANTFRLGLTPDPKELKSRTALMLSYLHPKLIPNKDTRPLEISKRLKFAAMALKGLTVFVQRPLGEASDVILSILTEAWSTKLWPWITCIYEKGITNPQLERIPGGAKRNLMNEIVEAFYYYSYHPALKNQVEATPGLKPLLTSLWYLEATDPVFDPYNQPQPTSDQDHRDIIFCPNFLTSRLLTVYMLSYTVEVDTVWAQYFLDVTSNKPAQVAIATLTQFQRNIDRMGSLTFQFQQLYDDIHIMGILSDFLPFQHAFLSQNSIRKATFALGKLVKQALPKKPRELNAASQCVSYLSLYLKMNIDVTDGVILMVCAIEAGLIPALLRCEQYLTDMPPADRTPTIMFLEVLPKQLLYLSVLRAVAQSFKAVDIANIERELDRSSLLWEAWSAFKSRAQERFQILGKLMTSSHRQCHNSKCAKADTERKFKRCTKCFSVVYCSNECNRVTWTEGGHEVQCNAIVARRLAGKSFPLSKADTFSSNKIFREDCRRSADEIVAKWEKDLKLPKDRPFLCIDYRRYPSITHTGIFTEFKPEGWEDGEIAVVNDLWTRLLQSAPSKKPDYSLLLAMFPTNETEVNLFAFILEPETEDESAEGGLLWKMGRALKSKQEW